MFRNAGKKIITPIIGGSHSVNSEITNNLQSIRWGHARRPLELGTSKSKLYVVRKRPTIDPLQQPDIQRLRKFYE